MNTRTEISSDQTAIEGFSLSPAQARAFRDYRSGILQASHVIVTWDNPTDLDQIKTLLEARVSSQKMFSTRVHLIDPPSIGLQMLSVGEIRYITVAKRADFDATLMAKFTSDRTESLRVVFEAVGSRLVRLGLAAPPYISDVDGLLRLIAIDSYEGELTFQHFSEWCLKAEQVRLEEEPPTSLNVGEITTTTRDRLRVARMRATQESGVKIDSHDAVAVAGAVLLPYLGEPDDDVAHCHVRLDGRLFDDFAKMAGPFRLTVPLAIPRTVQSPVDFVASVHLKLDEALIRQSIVADKATRDPIVTISVLDIPERSKLFADATIEAVEGIKADLHVHICFDKFSVDVTVSTVLADLDEAILKNIASRLTAALSRARINTSKSKSELGGLVRPVHPVFQSGTSSIIDLFTETVAIMPEAVAFLGDRSYSFTELADASQRLAAALLRRFSRKDRILILADRSFDAAVAMFGVLRAGMTCVPILKDFPDERIRKIQSLAKASGAVAEDKELIRAESILDVPVLPALGHPQMPIEPYVGTANDEAYILFTSGSTGEPKGVVVAQHSVINLLNALKERIFAATEGQLRLSVNAPLAFDSSMKQFFQITFGHTLVPIPANVRVDPEAMADFVVDREIFALDVTPTFLKAMIGAGFGRRAEKLPKIILVGGEAMDQALWDVVRQWDNCEVWNLYGPTEATVNTLVARVKDSEYPTLGQPLKGVSVACVDRQGFELPVGAAGELQIGGAGVAVGYIGACVEDAAKFLKGENGVPYYNSGDLVRRLPDGSFAFLGRRDDQVKVSGQRLELGEIEACLKRIPGVSNAAVIVDKSVEGDPRIVAGVVARQLPAFTETVDELIVELPTGHRISSINANETHYQFKEIFENKIYVDDKITYPDDAVVLDVGANIGLFSLFVSNFIPRARVYAFEPLIPIRRKLSLNMKRYAPNVLIFPYGLSDRERDEEFTYYPGYSMMSSQQVYANAAGERAVIKTYLTNAAESGDESAVVLVDKLDEVLDGRFDPEYHMCRLRRLSDVIDEAGIDRIDVLKIDVQRAELDVLRGIESRHFQKIRAVSMELHDDPGGMTRGRRGEISALLEGAGFLVETEQDPLLAGTDRWNLIAYRPNQVSCKNVIQFAKSPEKRIGEISPQSLTSALSAELPSYMVPRAVQLLDEIPRTPQGKLDKRRLLSLIDAPDRGESSLVVDNEVTAKPVKIEEPTTQKSERESKVSNSTSHTQSLLTIWREVLRKPDLTVTDNFFNNGGDSIRAILMQSKARGAGVAISLRDLHANPTIEGLLSKESDNAALESRSAKANLHPELATPSAAESLLAIWREVLRKPDLTPNDNFFNNGGDSIRAILMQSKARAAGISVSLKDLHAKPVIAELLPRGSSATGHSLFEKETFRQGASPVPETHTSQIAVQRKGDRQEARRWTATSMQRLMLLASMTRNDAHVFHNATITPVMLPFANDEFRRALVEVRRAHPIITARVEVEGDALDFVLDANAVDGDYSYENLSAFTRERQESMLIERVLAERASKFDPSTGRLVRFGVLERSPQQFDILVAEHHAVLDGYSLNAMIRELVERYRNIAVETTDDQKVFAAVMAEQTATDANEDSRNFWKQQFALAPASKSFAVARPRSQSASMKQVDVIVSNEFYPALLGCSRREGISTKGILFALHIEALSAALGEKPSHIGVVYSLRPEVEGSLSAIGNFLNVLPVPTAQQHEFLAEARSFDRFDRAVFGHKAISHDRLSDWIGSYAEVDSVFNFIQFAEPDKRKGDKHETERRFFAVDAMMPVSVDWDLSADRLHLGFQYDVNRIKDSQAQKLKTSFEAVVMRFLESEGAEQRPFPDPVGKKVVGILSRHLEHTPSPDALISDLGISSLQMLRIARQVMDECGIRYPVSDFLTLETVKSIIDLCRNGGDSVRLSFAELTPPRIGGSKLQIIGFPPVGGAPSILDAWCDLVPQDVSIYAFRYPDFSVVEDLSSVSFDHFINGLVRALEPIVGPQTIFIGASLGGVLAYETARRMATLPQSIVYVGAAAPSRDGLRFTYHLMDDAQLKNELFRMNTLPPHLVEDELLAPVLVTLRGMSQVTTSYRPILKALACEMTSIWPRSDAVVRKQDMMGWGNLTDRRFVLTEVEGGHAVLMNDPRAVYEAAGLSQKIQAILSDGRTR